MTDRDETPQEMAARHIAESEVRIARQKKLIEEMDRDDHPDAASRGRQVLAVFEETLRVLRRHAETLRDPPA